MAEGTASENKVAETIKAVQGFVESVPVYQDALQPAAKEIGTALHTVAKCVNVALLPLRGMVWGYDRVEAFINSRLTEKLSNVPPERIVTPRPEVAGPVLEALRFAGHDEDLRELYASLLATSMDIETAVAAHPAFAHMITQMSPDEARIMRFFASSFHFPVIDVIARRPEPDHGYTLHIANFSHIASEAGCEHDRCQYYIDNLCRLLLLQIPPGVHFTDPSAYEPLETDFQLDMHRRSIEMEGCTMEFKRKLVQRTMLGWQFCIACVIDRVNPVAQADQGLGQVTSPAASS